MDELLFNQSNWHWWLIIAALALFYIKAIITSQIRQKELIEKNKQQQKLYERKIIFASLYEKRAKIIEKSYRYLTQIEHKLSEFFILSIDNQHRAKAFEDIRLLIDEFSEFFHEHNIYFAQRDVIDIGESIKLSKNTLSFYYTSQQHTPEKPVNWQSIWNNFQHNFQQIKQRLDSEFRSMIGVGEIDTDMNIKE